jgi:hypothetical protein
VKRSRGLGQGIVFAKADPSRDVSGDPPGGASGSVWADDPDDLVFHRQRSKTGYGEKAAGTEEQDSHGDTQRP